MMRTIFSWLDRLEDRIRFALSRRPLVYGFVAGVGAVLFFRGVWYAADALPFMTWPVTLLLSLAILGGTGVLVSHFVPNDVIVSGAQRRPKLTERSTEGMAKTPTTQDIEQHLVEVKSALDRIEQRLRG